MNISIEIDAGHVLAVYFAVRDGDVAKTLEVGKGVLVDFNKEGLLLGVEMLSPAKVNIVERIGRKYRIPELSRARQSFKKAVHELMAA